MNSIAAITIPTSTAMTRSKTTVSPNAVSRTSASLRGILRRRTSSCHSPMRRETTIRTADMAAMGMRPAHCEASSTMPSRVIA